MAAAYTAPTKSIRGRPKTNEEKLARCLVTLVERVMILEELEASRPDLKYLSRVPKEIQDARKTVARFEKEKAKLEWLLANKPNSKNNSNQGLTG